MNFDPDKLTLKFQAHLYIQIYLKRGKQFPELLSKNIFTAEICYQFPHQHQLDGSFPNPTGNTLEISARIFLKIGGVL